MYVCEFMYVNFSLGLKGTSLETSIYHLIKKRLNCSSVKIIIRLDISAMRECLVTKNTF